MNTAKESILRGMARAFFASAWADQADECGESLRGEILDQIPADFDPAAIRAADTLLKDIESLHGPIESVYESNRGGLDWITWGHYAAMQAMGHGVGLWEYGIEARIPYVEFGSHSLEKDYFGSTEQ